MTTSSAIGKLLFGAAVIGGVAGYSSIASSPEGRERVSAQFADVTEGVGQVAVAAGLARARTPQSGDSWGGCNDARAAGTAPIYRGEPGYRENMDGDGDGVACESY